MMLPPHTDKYNTYLLFVNTHATAGISPRQYGVFLNEFSVILKALATVRIVNGRVTAFVVLPFYPMDRNIPPMQYPPFVLRLNEWQEPPVDEQCH